MSTTVPLLTGNFGRIYEGMRQSQSLEKIAGVTTGDAQATALLQQAAVDNATFELMKTAIDWNTVKTTGQGLAQRFWQHPAGRAATLGAAGAAGAAVPGVLALNAASNHASDQMRNKALEAGVGLAGVGATMYGLHHLLGGGSKTAADAAAEDTAVAEALQKLAAVGYLDALLTETLTDAATGEETRKLAAEVQLLNRQFGVDILRKLSK